MEDQSEQPLGVRGQSLSDTAMLFHEVSVWSIASTPKNVEKSLIISYHYFPTIFTVAFLIFVFTSTSISLGLRCLQILREKHRPCDGPLGGLNWSS